MLFFVNKNDSNMAMRDSFTYYNEENIHPGFSVDCVILSFYKKKLRVLLNKFLLENYWSLPGGFLFKNETANEAAKRILKVRTGLSDIYLEQFYLFSDPKRTDIEQNRAFVREQGVDEERAQWYLQRFITLGYFSLVRYDNIEIPKEEIDTTKWFDLNALPLLYSDHENIIKKALEVIRSRYLIIPIGYLLLPEKFILPDLRRIYEQVLGKTLDRRNFQRKVLSKGWIVQLDEKQDTHRHNPPILYRFNISDKDYLFDFSLKMF